MYSTATTRRLLSLALIAALVAGGSLCGYYIYSLAKQAVVHAQFELPDPPSLPGAQPQGTKLAADAILSTPRAGDATPVPSSFRQRNERLNILVLGLDVPDGGAEPARTDTIIVVSIDPYGGPISMLSIPRDLWVPIGPYGENRINTAYFSGEVRDYPGGGAGLLRAVVEQTFGIPIDYYVSVDFEGFRDVVDYLGGVPIEVASDIYDPSYPDGHGGVYAITIPAGTYRMDGETALQYARSRHTSSDFDRAGRQQQLLVAIKDEVMRREGMSGLITKLPGLYRTLSGKFETDLSLDDLIALARLASSLDLNNVHTAVIDHTMTTKYITDKGWDVLLPIPERIQPLIQQLFLPPRSAGAAAPRDAVDPASLVVEEAATVLVVNGSGRPGLAQSVADYLRSQGFRIKDAVDLDRGDYTYTTLVAYADKPATIASLAAALGLSSQNVRRASAGPDADSADLKLILGQDLKLPLD